MLCIIFQIVHFLIVLFVSVSDFLLQFMVVFVVSRVVGLFGVSKLDFYVISQMILVNSDFHSIEIIDLLLCFCLIKFFKPSFCFGHMFFHWFVESLSLSQSFLSQIVSQMDSSTQLVHLFGILVRLQVRWNLVSSLILFFFYDLHSLSLFALSCQLIIFLIELFCFLQQHLLFGFLLQSMADSKHLSKLQKLLLSNFQFYQMSDDSDISSPPKAKIGSPIKKVVQKNDKQIELLEENKNLRRKLKQLSARLDDQLEKAAKQKLKASVNYVSTATSESQSLQLQNAYKMIERLQKTVKDFQSKQAYQISFKRILDLQSIIKKKDVEVEDLKLQLKDSKKTIRDKEKHVNDLLDRQATNPNINQQKQQINKLKLMLKKIQIQNDQLKKKQLQKHKKLITVQRKLVQMQQQQEQPVAVQQEVLDDLQNYKAKYKQAMMRIQKQNLYITKLNSKITTLQQNSSQKRVRSHIITQDRQVSRSLDELPDLPNRKAKHPILDHIPSPNLPNKLLRRY